MNNNQTARICPECGKHYTAVPALSRKDNQTLICPDCGIFQALESLGINEKEQNVIIQIIHQAISEKK